MATTTLRVPITNVYGGGDYTAAISIGTGYHLRDRRLDWTSGNDEPDDGSQRSVRFFRYLSRAHR
jgi:hypothetical protein